MALEQAVDAVNPSEPNTVGDGESIKLPKNCKENRYYHRHKEEILEKRRQKRMEDPEYQAKQKAKEEKKKQKEEEAKKRALKKELRQKVVEQFLNPLPIPSGAIQIK